MDWGTVVGGVRWAKKLFADDNVNVVFVDRKEVRRAFAAFVAWPTVFSEERNPMSDVYERSSHGDSYRCRAPGVPDVCTKRHIP